MKVTAWQVTQQTKERFEQPKEELFKTRRDERLPQLPQKDHPAPLFRGGSAIGKSQQLQDDQSQQTSVKVENTGRNSAETSNIQPPNKITKDKYFIENQRLSFSRQLNLKIQNSLEENCAKGKLKSHVEKCEFIGANKFIIDTILNKITNCRLLTLQNL